MHSNSQVLSSATSLSRNVGYEKTISMKTAQNFSQEEAAFGTLVANCDGYKRVLPPGAIPTLTQSGLLAVLLERQRYKAVQSAWRHVRCEKMRAVFWRTLTWPLHVRTAPTAARDSAKPLVGTIPRHT
jgi:hypothetical protein